jgi:hypothetical protein
LLDKRIKLTRGYWFPARPGPTRGKSTTSCYYRLPKKNNTTRLDSYSDTHKHPCPRTTLRLDHQ